MDRLGLNQKTLQSIKDDGILFGKIASTLGISPVSLPRLLYANDAKLTQAAILRILREHLGIKQDNKLLSEIPKHELA